MGSRSPFDALVDAYDAARPTYPDRLFADLERLAGRPVAGADVVEVGAGTGIATRRLLDLGARVVPVDLGAAMLTRLRERTPGIPAVLGDAEALPLRSGVADLVCFAQAWHWVRVPVAAAEVARVLRPGGSLAVWWNDVDAEDERWWRRQQERLEAMSPGYRREYRTRPYAEELRWTGHFAEVLTLGGRWRRRLDIDTYLTWLRSKSYVAAIGDRQEDFLDAERRSMLRTFPDGIVEEPFRTLLVVARRP
ncbi:methyltransferase domain-containing protein [Frankia sp. CNm7]|uniref:Methyltransferase domain-containing protein n=1 Tax=Frankia nepalensis TaxID=1836974 RepID=A0A937RQB4_9ACTN|nr:class I SAM-dependent methyltransferase [Frankia nepalensis]MBL7496011.1 methyltransferase domain-containing protein [Frankia nepalensis]MBL7514939.1 methyltransferase domain-containing protein [Frankia nepalensis]MBL7524497.1 methyltransferase domain-containing protein [Frankia nepalensis]MBL7631434.1 methyltransferase domain-containing protein [Frankia nepalensis]